MNNPFTALAVGVISVMFMASKWFKEMYKSIKFKLKQYRRVLSIIKYPSKEEFMVGFKITGLGMLLIGLIGFIVKFLMDFIK